MTKIENLQNEIMSIKNYIKSFRKANKYNMNFEKEFKIEKLKDNIFALQLEIKMLEANANII